MQRINAAHPLAFHQGAQGRQRHIGSPAAKLRPGQQHGLQNLRQPLARQGADAAFRDIPVPGLDLLIDQQKLRRLHIRQQASKTHRLGPPGHQIGNKGRLHQLQITRLGRQSAQQCLGGDILVALMRGKPAVQKGPVNPARQKPPGAARRRVRQRRIGWRGGTKQQSRQGRQRQSTKYKTGLHRPRITVKPRRCHARYMQMSAFNELSD